MNKSIEISAKTQEEAISQGLEALGASIGDVNIDILQEGSKGLFGLFGSRLAKVRLTLKTDDPEEAQQLVAEVFRHQPEDNTVKNRNSSKADNDQSVEPAVKEDRSLSSTEKPAKAAKPDRSAQENVPEASDKPVKKSNPEKKQDNRKASAAKGEKPASGKTEKSPAVKGENPVAAKGDKPTAAKTKQQSSRAKKSREPKSVQNDDSSKEDKKMISSPEQIQLSIDLTRSFLEELTRLMGVEVTIDVKADEEGAIRANIEGDTLGILIGRRGETLDAVQYLTSLKVNKGRDEYTRVTIDTEHYRAKREDALIRLANRMANRVQKTGRKVSMEAMNPYERRIMHSALQNNEYVLTHSEGEGLNRHVVITPRKNRPTREEDT